MDHGPPGPWSVRLGLPGHRSRPDTRVCPGELTTGRAARGPLGIFAIFPYHGTGCDAGGARQYLIGFFRMLRTNCYYGH